MADVVEIKLPVSGSSVVIRNYTTRGDDKKAASLLYVGVEAKDTGGDAEKRTIAFPIANVMAAQESYIPRLVQSIDGDNSNISIRLDELKSEDYEAIEKAVDKIVGEHSPKAVEAKKASTSAIKES